MKNKVTVSAPGKLMLFGEHSVVYGNPCIVTAVDERITATVARSGGTKINLTAPGVDLKGFEADISTDLDKLPKGAKFVFSTVKEFNRKYKKSEGFIIETRSDFSSKFGFGSSSAVTVCTVKALAEIYDMELSNKELFDIAYRAVLVVQGVGSGFDVASAVWGGTIYFVGKGKAIRSLNTKGLPLVVGYTGIKADTTTLVRQVADLYKIQKAKIGNIFMSINNIVEEAGEAVEDKDYSKMGRLMNKNQKLLGELGVSSNELDGLIKASLSAGALGAKLSGAGGGDCMIALTSKGKKEAVERAITKAGGIVLKVMTGAEGVRVEKQTKATAKAPANIAFIKYWGKRNEKLRLPANSSISMNLSGAYTTTSVEFDEKLGKDCLILGETVASDEETSRVSKHLDLIRKRAGITKYALVESENNFPKGAGIASSASGFAALTLAASNAAGLNLSEKELSILARLGSGSACRSIPDGFAEWKEGETSDDSYAHSLYKENYWDICDLIAVTGEKSKKVGSSEGHAVAESSPFYKERIKGMKNKIRALKASLKKKDFSKFGEIIEAESVNMHTVMMTSVPPLFYWSSETLAVINKVIEMRERGVECYFTIDAGPNLHVICELKNASRLEKILSKVSGVKKVIKNMPAKGARLM